jgi:hypothetical protein
MNEKFLAIVKYIITEQGEAVLGDPARLKPLVKDYAQKVRQDERRAFGRCIEADFYRRIKTADTVEGRRRLKVDLARQLQNAAGLSAALCSGALDILDAAVPLPGAQSTSPTSIGTFAGKTGMLAGKLTRKTLIFGVSGGVGAFVGELVSEVFRLNDISWGVTFWHLVLNVGIWAAFIGFGITISLNLAQGIYQKRTPPFAILLKTVFIGIVIGVAGGAIAQILFAFTSYISTFVEIASRVICWGILGWGLGFGASFYVPNYPVQRAMLAGLLGGVIGGTVFRATFILPEPLARVIGVTILGLFIGSAIAFIEEALREAWLTVVWGPKETTTISLGAKSVVFGSSRGVDVYLPPGHGDMKPLPVCAIVGIEGGRVVLDDRVNGTRRELRNGETADLGRVSIIANIKKGS